MKWQSPGIVLSVRAFAERAQVVTMMTPEYGRCSGLIRTTSKNRFTLQPGHHGEATWSARLAEHLGQWQMEVTSTPSAHLLNRPPQLAALGSICLLVDRLLPERHPYPSIFDALSQLIEDLIRAEDWLKSYALFELYLLEQTGFGLDLSCCGATGVTENLIYVSPKTGRAISHEAGAPYHDKLLPLPEFWVNPLGPITKQTCLDALRTTGYFLNKHLEGGGTLRQRLVELVAL